MTNEGTSFSLAKEYEHKEQFDLAAKYYEQAIGSDGGEPALAHQGLCRALARLKRFDEAFNEGQRALELNPNLAMVRSILGHIYFLRGNYVQAAQEFSLALHLEPDNHLDLKNLAIVYGALGDLKAIEPLKKYVNHCPNDFEAKLDLANLYTQQRDYRTAFAGMNEIFRAKPFFLRLYAAYAYLLVHPISIAFGKLNIWIRTGISLSVLLVPVFAPGIISIPLGILLSVYLFLTLVIIFTYGKGWGHFLSILIYTSFYAGFYWILVWLHWIVTLGGYPSA